MKIAHLCLSCFYVDGYSYQENELVRQHVQDGHDVVVIASTEVFDQHRQLNYCSPGEYMGTDGARVIRLPYRRWLPHSVMKKLRMHPGVEELLAREAPDVILFHGLCGWELLNVKRHKSRNPAVRVFADSHEDFNNSAQSFVSKHFLHASYYRPILHRALGSIEKVLCISSETMDFVRNFYKVPAEHLELYPLGGKVFDDDEYASIRTTARTRYGITDDQILFVQSGKIDKAKKLVEALRAFSRTPDKNFRFTVAGHIHKDISAEVEQLIKQDTRVRFIGWQSSQELRELLCAADVYVQPGTQSATMQMSLCCRCAVVLDEVPSHLPYMNQNGWLIGPQCTLEDVFTKISEEPNSLPAKAIQSAGLAARLLDYRVLAARILQKPTSTLPPACTHEKY